MPSIIHSVQLSNVGIFNLAPTCRAYGSGIMLLSNTKYESNDTIPIIPPVDIEIDCCDVLDSVVKDDVKVPTLKLPKYLKTVAMHADD